MSTRVYHSGVTPCDIVVVGEAPGHHEARIGKPFVGPSGTDLSMYLAHCGRGYHPSSCYITNVVKEYLPDNPDPTPELIDEWTGYLQDEIAQCQPKVILAVGRFAAWWFLGGQGKYPMRMIHGRPCYAGEFDSEYKDRACGAVVVPCYHPAAGLHNEAMKPTIYRDFLAAIEVYESDGSYDVPTDYFLGLENYEDIPAHGMAEYLECALGDNLDVLAIDTEGTVDYPWSIQVSAREGEGFMLRGDANSWSNIVEHLQPLISQFTLIFHNAKFDISMCRAMGFDFSNCRIVDTMAMAYILHEPQGLKSLAWRHCGMSMGSYRDLVGDIGLNKQVEYLISVADLDLPKPVKRNVILNDASSKLYGPNSLSVKAAGIVADVANNKVDKDGNPVDPYKRWAEDKAQGTERKLYLRELRLEIEARIGAMPQGGIQDIYEIDPDKATRYACRDSDAALRTFNSLLGKLS